MTSKIEDIEGILAKIRAAPEAFPSGASMTPRRVFIYRVGVLEYPKWLSEYWLENGYWASISCRTMSMPEFIREMEAVIDDLRKKQEFMEFFGAGTS